MTKLRSVLPAIASAAAVALFLSACHFLGVASASADGMSDGGTGSVVDWTTVLLGINAALLGVLAVLGGLRTWFAYRAPRTPALWDDRARDLLSEAINVLNVFRGITHDIASGRGASTTTVIVEQPKPEPAALADPPADFDRNPHSG